MPRDPTDHSSRTLALADPAKAKGDEEEIMAVFRAVRDEIRARVTQPLKDILT